MDELDKAILRQVQSKLPIDAHPYARVGQRWG